VLNKIKIMEFLTDLNKYKRIKIQDSDKERLIFLDSDTVFKHFGGEDKVLLPYNDYSYEWLNSFFYNVIDLIKSNDFEDLEELSESINDHVHEWADSETDVYTSDLTEWLNASPYNVTYLEDAIKEYGSDCDNLLMAAQYTAITEAFCNAVSCLISCLEFEDLDQEDEDDKPVLKAVVE